MKKTLFSIIFLQFSQKTNLQFQCAKTVGWALSILVMLLTVYGLYPGNLTVFTSSIYAAFGHTSWAIAVAFLVVQCCTGSASMINNFLSLRLLYPLSRLTYCAYLVHPVIMMITVTQMDGPLHLHNSMVVRAYIHISYARHTLLYRYIQASLIII